MARAVFVASVVVTVLLYTSPQLRAAAYPLLLISTFVHEMGHGLAGLLVGGQFVSFELFSDGSGVASIAGVASRMGQAAVSAGGLVGPAFASALSFSAGKRPSSARAFLGCLCAALVIALFLVVRNAFAWFFVAGFALLLAWVVFGASARMAQIVLLFLGTQLGLSVYSRSDYLFTKVAHTVAGPVPSDVAEMETALLLPYWFWGAVCGAISVWALFVGAQALWRKS